MYAMQNLVMGKEEQNVPTTSKHIGNRYIPQRILMPCLIKRKSIDPSIVPILTGLDRRSKSLHRLRMGNELAAPQGIQAIDEYESRLAESRNFLIVLILTQL
jgi:hypothetical protein